MVAIVVPVNVLLPPGLGLRINDGPPKKIAYKTCDQNGCIASLAADETLYNAIAGAAQISVVVTSLDGKSVQIALSPKGLNNGTRGMSEAEGKRHSWLRRAFL
jgi:invasion protein IalB